MESATLQYDVYFPPGYNFVKGEAAATESIRSKEGRTAQGLRSLEMQAHADILCRMHESSQLSIHAMPGAKEREMGIFETQSD